VNNQENARFTRYLLDAVQHALKLGYPANEFKKMLDGEGGFETVKRIVPKRAPSSGFFRLLELKRIDLTCEAIIVETEWRRFFDEDLLEIAEKRLRDFQYPYQAYVDPAPEPSQVTTAADATDFTPPQKDGRERELRNVVSRPGQGAFREALRTHYGSRCCVSGCSVIDALEAAHVTSYRGDSSDHVGNGLLLRADLHTLYDRYLFSIDPRSLEVVMADRIRVDPTYRQFHSLRLFASGPKPSRAALEVHWLTFQEAEESRPQTFIESSGVVHG
jgi:hypothetical protein